MFERLGPWCHDHRKVVVGVWVAVLILGGIVSGSVGGAFRDEFNLPDVESKKGFEMLDRGFSGEGTGMVGTIARKASHIRLPSADGTSKVRLMDRAVHTLGAV
jgi:hypothetical protein